ncbi:hypothetical protein BDV96DRAFT_305109 [Lophiotrema nucula]|uniref:Heterokaryon incompatibility domain-containing protein n=1 Tax=Lophiotrema nucula TaxID=690887 RepID=A0A6A5YMI9_9PLEO|nr:hypothetical protein BDV96DRAFT_305109 [Lophiotrema nucula]
MANGSKRQASRGCCVGHSTEHDIRCGPTPSILASVPVATPYLWFDLVCMPQDRSERADIEIAKQASIFRQATHSIIWFNQIDDWAGSRHTVDWMCRRYLARFSKAQPSMSDLPTGFFQNYDFQASLTESDMEAIGWFTSLWTLQEICLRPDMWLCSSDWQLFTVGNNVPISFNTIIALVGECLTISHGEAALKNTHDLDLSKTFMTRTERLRIDGRQYLPMRLYRAGGVG